MTLNKNTSDEETEELIRKELRNSTIKAYLKFFLLSIIVSLFIVVLTVVILIVFNFLFGTYFDINWVIFMLSGLMFFLGSLIASFKSSITIHKIMNMLFGTKNINKNIVNQAFRAGIFYFLIGIDLFILDAILIFTK